MHRVEWVRKGQFGGTVIGHSTYRDQRHADTMMDKVEIFGGPREGILAAAIYSWRDDEWSPLAWSGTAEAIDALPSMPERYKER